MFGKKSKQAVEKNTHERVDEQAAEFEAHPEKIEEVVGGFNEKFAAAAGKLPLATEMAAAYYSIRDSKTPLKVKATLAAALAYFILPTDAIPDFVAGLGFTDDAGVLMLVLNRVRQYVTPEHFELAKAKLKRSNKSAK